MSPTKRAPATRERIFNSDLPTLAFRQGDFSSLLPDTQIIDPLTGDPFPNNIIPSERLNPTALRVQESFYPQPNFGSPDEFQSNWRGVGQGSLYKTQAEGRIDHKLSESNSVDSMFPIRGPSAEDRIESEMELCLILNKN